MLRPLLLLGLLTFCRTDHGYLPRPVDWVYRGNEIDAGLDEEKEKAIARRPGIFYSGLLDPVSSYTIESRRLLEKRSGPNFVVRGIDADDFSKWQVSNIINPVRPGK
ncbi:unnamed protein product, partial [Mesorhabditis spiculigera]